MLASIKRKVVAAKRAMLGVHQGITEFENRPIEKIMRKSSDSLDGLGVRDIPMYAFPVRDIPRLEKGGGYRPINRILSPPAIRN